MVLKIVCKTVVDVLILVQLLMMNESDINARLLARVNKFRVKKLTLDEMKGEKISRGSYVTGLAIGLVFSLTVEIYIFFLAKTYKDQADKEDGEYGPSMYN